MVAVVEHLVAGVGCLSESLLVELQSSDCFQEGTLQLLQSRCIVNFHTFGICCAGCFELKWISAVSTSGVNVVKHRCRALLQDATRHLRSTRSTASGLNSIECSYCLMWVHRRRVPTSPGLLQTWEGDGVTFPCSACVSTDLPGSVERTFDMCAALKR